MRRYLSILAAFLFLAATLVSAQEDKKGKAVKTPNYYPLQVGNKWTFRVESGANTVAAVSSIAKIETIDGTPLARLEAVINEKTFTEHLIQTDKGIFRHRNNDQVISPPIKLLQYPAKPGDKWQGDIAFGKEKGTYSCETKDESVQVPAGKFKAIRVDIKLETDDNGVKKEMKTSYWFVEDVGFVKQTLVAGNLKLTMELEKFVPAKVNKGKKETK